MTQDEAECAQAFAGHLLCCVHPLVRIRAASASLSIYLYRVRRHTTGMGVVQRAGDLSMQSDGESKGEVEWVAGEHSTLAAHSIRGRGGDAVGEHSPEGEIQV